MAWECQRPGDAEICTLFMDQFLRNHIKRCQGTDTHELQNLQEAEDVLQSWPILPTF